MQMSTRLSRWIQLGFAIFLSAELAAAQTTSPSKTKDGPSPTVNNAGRISDTSVGEVGQRIIPSLKADELAPTARIASRIQNRVPTRFNSRIDRNYDPEAGVVPSFDTDRSKPVARRPR